MSTLIKEQVMVKPTFLFIGADRCGSKSLHQFFRQHPQCYVPPIADPCFFDWYYERGMDWYFNLFSKAPATALAIGEFTHDYIQSPEAASRIAEHLPNVKLLATLRHPIERAFSSYASAHSAGEIRTSFEQALRDEPTLISKSLYADRLEVYFDMFGRERLKVMFFEDLESDPQTFAQEAFAHVGLPPAPVETGRRMSQLSRSRWPLAGTMAKTGAKTLRAIGWVTLLGRLKSNATFRRFFYTPYTADDRPQVPPDVRKRLSETFAPQIDRLEKMLERDLTAWRS